MDQPFLRHLGERERSPLRWLAWLAIAVLLSLVGVTLVSSMLQALNLGPLLTAVSDGPLADGPGRLLDETRFTFAIAALLITLALAVLYGARLAFHRPGWTFVSPARPFRMRLLLLGFGLFGALVLVSLFIERAIRGEPLAPPVLSEGYALDDRLVYAGGALLFLLIAAAAEEILFRGVLLQFTAAFTRSLPVLLIVNGLIFSAFHADPSPGAFVARALSGAVWAWTVLRLSGMEFAIGAHLANNLVLCLLVEPISEGAQVGRDYPLGALAGDLAITGVLVLLLQAALRSPRVQDWAAPEPIAKA
jgi:membrane protease YdiL (CAAX protease family)